MELLETCLFTSFRARAKQCLIDAASIALYDPGMKKNFLMIVLLLAVAAVFEFLPAIKQGRYVIPEDVYVQKTCNCQCIASSRPWYSTFNYWHWLWIAIVPVLIFSIKPDAARVQKATVVLVSIGLCYLLMNLSVHLFWDIRNGPFVVSPDPTFPSQKTWDMQCADIGDGASLTFALLFGWIPAGLYTGFCYAIRSAAQSRLKNRMA